VPGANFSGANLSNTEELGSSTGSAFYDEQTDFTDACSTSLDYFGNCWAGVFDPVAAGWMLAGASVPSLGLGPLGALASLLLTLGLAGLGMRRRH